VFPDASEIVIVVVPAATPVIETTPLAIVAVAVASSAEVAEEAPENVKVAAAPTAKSTVALTTGILETETDSI
jgi:hypothetical protein